jgi:methyltransferase-like protein 6
MNLEFEEIVKNLRSEYAKEVSLVPSPTSSTRKDDAPVLKSEDGVGLLSAVVDRRNRRDEALPQEDSWTDQRRQEAAAELKAQGDGVSEFWRKHYIDKAPAFWHAFYKRNADRFYKDRHYLHEEFPELLKASVMLEVGCGVGNAVVPLFELNKSLKVYACDYAVSAIDILKQHPIHTQYPGQLCASVCDVIHDNLPTATEQCDVILCLFVLSAMAPENMPAVMTKLYKTLRPGGRLLVRDYGQYDEAQMRFKKGSKLSDNFYVRQDSTCSYFFSQEFLGQLCRDAGFRPVEQRCENICKAQENRQQQKSRHRVWVQGVFEK